MLQYVGPQTTDPYQGLNLRSHLTGNIRFPAYIDDFHTSSQFKASRLVPESLFSLEKIVARRYEVCDNDGAHAYDDYPMVIFNGKQLPYQVEAGDMTPSYTA